MHTTELLASAIGARPCWPATLAVKGADLMIRKRLTLALLVGLLVTAAASPAQAAGSQPGLVESWWNWLAAWAQSVLVGPAIDPLGTPSSATGQADVGPLSDPFGGNRTMTGGAGQADVGPDIDPLGGK